MTDLNDPVVEVDALEQQIIDYLAAHPDFLLNHPEVLEKQAIGHDAGGAVSLIERKLKLTEEQNRNYRRQLGELVAIARDNDQLNRRLHRLSLRLIEAEDLEDALVTLKEELRTDFQADAVDVKLFSAEELAAHANENGPALFADFIENDKPSCGRIDSAKLRFLFGAQAGEAGSVALVPIRSAQLTGVLAIGSRDENRFHPGKGVDFLHQLGELTSALLDKAVTNGQRDD